MARDRIEVLGVADTDDELSRFATWYLSQSPNLPVKPPMDKALHIVEGLHAVVLWRQERFQVELISCSSGIVIPPHSHPNVDSYEVNLNGAVDFFIGDRRTIPLSVLNRQEGIHCAWYGLAVRVRPGVIHRADFGAEGGVFMSIQHWPEGLEMASVGCDWDGNKTMGPTHSTILGGSHD